MCCGIVGNDLMVLVPFDEFDAVLRTLFLPIASAPEAVRA
jgi:hypothetical protein